MHISKQALERYLQDQWGPDVTVRSFGRIGDVQSRHVLKGFGYGSPVVIEARVGGRPWPMLWDYATYNCLPRHARALDVGAFTPQGWLRSVADAREFFLLSEFVEGEEYQRDLARIARTGKLERQDMARARALADYLVEIHGVKKRFPGLYRRALRDLIGHGVCLMGVVDSYPENFNFITPALLESIERRCNAWRWRLREKSGRLSQVHGDFHPWNVLFRKGADFSVLDRSRGEWGEPADDVTSMTINYLFFSL